MNYIIAIAIALVIGFPILGNLIRSRGIAPPEWKYFKPFSMTWWAGAIPAALGAFIASEPIHQLASWSDALSTMAGNAPPGTLIAMGLGAIGLRGKDG